MPYDVNFVLFVPFTPSMDPSLSDLTFNHAFSSAKYYVMLQSFSPSFTVVVALGILHPALSSVFCRVPVLLSYVWALTLYLVIIQSVLPIQS